MPVNFNSSKTGKALRLKMSIPESTRAFTDCRYPVEIKKLRSLKDKKEAQDLLKTVTSMIDKLAKKNIIHTNNAANKKSSLTKLVNSL